MTNLAFRSLVVLGVLFGLLFAVLIGALYAMDMPSSVALPLSLAIAVGISAIQFAISPTLLQWILKINWVEPEAISPKLGSRLREMCLQRRLKVPRFGIIEDGNPNAFTFGHWPSDARLVMTRGLLEICDEEETAAVMAHELGHIVHWDFVVMTVAATVPMVLYVIYRFGIRAGRGRGKGAGAITLVALGAFVAYLISQYIVLFLSRVREYYADQHAALATRNPNALASALVKIAYGLARQQPAVADAQHQQPALVAAGGAKMMGVFDPKYGSSMALAAAGAYNDATHSYDRDTTVRAMRWDLWNPWAFVAELSSSHPLPAKRLRALDRLALGYGQQPLYDLPQRQPESYWDEFATDLFMNYVPVIGLLVAGIGALAMTGVREDAWYFVGGVALFGWAVGNMIRLHFAYPKHEFPGGQISELVGEVKVSNIRCKPVTLRGKIIGRGIPGLYWSQDLVIHDGSGFMVMLYRQPIKILEFLFGLFRAESFVGQNVVAQGWYRRYPVPFLELYKVQLPDGTMHTSHNWAAKFWGTILAFVIAGGLALFGMMQLLAG
jgi:Zn-dependent protease with chaperone function